MNPNPPPPAGCGAMVIGATNKEGVGNGEAARDGKGIAKLLDITGGMGG